MSHIYRRSFRFGSLAVFLVLLMFAALPVQHAQAVSYYKILYVEKTWLEPNTLAYVNHCGPGATQVALDIRLPASQVPSIDVLATEEKTNVGKVGTYMSDIVPVLNKRLNTSWYIYGHATSQDTFKGWLKADLNYNFAMVTGVMTGGMPGWGTRNVAHIVAVVGYSESTDGNTTWVFYNETAGSVAGYNGSHYESVSLSKFWGFTMNNSWQAW